MKKDEYIYTVFQEDDDNAERFKIMYYIIFTLLGFVFGPLAFLLLFFLATLYGALIGVIVLQVKKTGRKTKIPFAPSIGLAAFTVFYYGEAIIQWYLSYFL